MPPIGYVTLEAKRTAFRNDSVYNRSDPGSLWSFSGPSPIPTKKRSYADTEPECTPPSDSLLKRISSTSPSLFLH